MKKFIQVFIFIAFILISGQHKRFAYDYTFVSDSTQPHEISKTVMFLDVIKSKSQFYSAEKYKVDSVLAADEKNGINSMPPNKNFITFRVLKDDAAVETILEVDNQKYKVTDSRRLNWKITDETDQIFGYPVQKAETTFGGRKWTAWFTPDIPIQDGPYKFQGLPGLILKIYDLKKNHQFLISGIMNLKNNILDYPEFKNAKSLIKINHTRFVQLYKAERKDPLGSTRGRYPDQTDSAGNFRTGAQVFREREKAFKDRIQKDNNVIELDLLKY